LQFQITRKRLIRLSLSGDYATG